MSFLYPNFLFALSAIAIPILVHLFNFRRFKRVYFSNVAFLQEIKEQTASKEKLKSILVLLARILAVFFMVMAFAQPYFAEATDESRKNVVSIYIDNSYSMDAADKQGSLLDEAKRRARELVKSYRINDRFQLLTNDFEGRHQRLLNADEFLKALEDVKISPSVKTLQQVVNRQAAIFSGDVNQVAYIVSDFQQNFVAQQNINLSKNIKLLFVRLKANDLPNVAVDSVWFLSPVHMPGGAERLVIRLKNGGNQNAKRISVKLTINNQQKAIASLDIPARSAKTDTVTFGGLAAGWQKGMVSIKDHPLVFDNQLYFTFNVARQQRVLALNGADAPRNLRALFSSDSYFNLDEMSEGEINYSAFSGYSLILLNGLQNPSSGLSQELKNYLNGGGSVAVFPSTAPNWATYNTFFSALKLPQISKLNVENIGVENAELKSALFKDVFEEVPKKIALPLVNRYFSFVENNNSGKEDLMRLPGNRLFLARYQRNGGHVYVCATGLATADGNFSRHPIFVPLLYKIAFASVQQQPLFYTVGNSQAVFFNKINLSGNKALQLSGDGFEFIPEVRQSNGSTQLFFADQIKKSGFYQLKSNGNLLAVMAFNDNRLESDIRYATNANLANIKSDNQIAVIEAGKQSLAAQAKLQNKAGELWKLCLILSLVFIATEIILIKYYNPKIAKT